MLFIRNGKLVAEAYKKDINGTENHQKAEYHLEDQIFI